MQILYEVDAKLSIYMSVCLRETARVGGREMTEYMYLYIQKQKDTKRNICKDVDQKH